MKSLKLKLNILAFLCACAYTGVGFSQVVENSQNKSFQEYFQALQLESTNHLGYQFHSGGWISVPLNQNTKFEMGVLSDKTALYRSIDVPLRLRHKLAKNLHLFYGAKFQNISGIGNNAQLINSNQTFLEMGLQFDMSNQLMLELGSSFMLNNSNETYRYHLDTSAKNLIKLGAGYKF